MFVVVRMNQALKNKYNSFIKVTDYQTLELVNSIFREIDNLLLTEKGKNHQEKFLDLISVLEFTEDVLYEEIKKDILNGVLS